MEIKPETYKDPKIVSQLADEIQTLSSEMAPVKIMHVCGTHEHEIARYGIRQLLPPKVKIVPGPGCPVCICPVEDIDQAIAMAYRPNTTLLSFGDMIKVPSTKESLEDARRNGGSVKLIYSPFDAIKLAKENPEETFVFFSVGFETTAAGVAAMIQKGVPDNLYFLIANRYLPPIMELLMDIHDNSIDGFMLPGHAATITGPHAYDFMVSEYDLPCAVTGFEPVDLLLGIFDLLKLIKKGKAEIVNSYPRMVRENGNLKALAALDEVFDLKSGIWRGIDKIDGTGYELKEKYQYLDAKKQMDQQLEYASRSHHTACECHRIMLGEVEPSHCKLFKTACTPNSPFGPCMVSVDGTCHSWFVYGSPEDNQFEM